MNQERLQIRVLVFAFHVRVFNLVNLLQLELSVTGITYHFLVQRAVLRARENVRTEWVQGNEREVRTLIILPLDMADLLNCFGTWYTVRLCLRLPLSNRIVGVTHAVHNQATCLMHLLLRDLVRLAEDELLVKELGQRLSLASLLIDVLLLNTKLLRKDRMVPDVFSKRHFNLIVWNLLLLVQDYVVFFQLEPFFESYVENYIVLEMQRANVKRLIRRVHDSVINLVLREKLSITPVIIELQCLDKISLVIRILFIGLDNGHVALLRLNNVH